MELSDNVKKVKAEKLAEADAVAASLFSSDAIDDDPVASAKMLMSAVFEVGDAMAKASSERAVLRPLHALGHLLSCAAQWVRNDKVGDAKQRAQEAWDNLVQAVIIVHDGPPVLGHELTVDVLASAHAAMVPLSVAEEPNHPYGEGPRRYIDALDEVNETAGLWLVQNAYRVGALFSLTIMDSIPEEQWSEPATMETWERRFNLTERQLHTRRATRTLIMRQHPDGQGWQVHRDQVPDPTDVLTEPMTRGQIGKWFGTHRNNVNESVLEKYWHQEEPNGRIRMRAADMPAAYHAKLRK